DHAFTLGELRAVAGRYGPVGLIDFDSHTDTWDSYWGERYTHGTWCRRGIERVVADVNDRIGSGPVFLTFDIDFVDPGFAPGTGTPEVGGPSSRDALRLVRGLRGLDLVGFDMVEVQPQYDHGEVTSLLAGTLLHEFLTLVALNRGTL